MAAPRRGLLPHGGSPARRGARRSRGQSLTELALLAPLLLLLLLGAGQLGALVYTGVSLDTAAHDGARLASEQPNGSGAYTGGIHNAGTVTCPPTTGNPVCTAVSNGSGLLSGVQTSIQAISCPAGDWTSCAASDCASGWVAGGYVQVTVTEQTPIFVPIVGAIFSSGSGIRTMTSTVTMRVEPCTMTQGR
jgi:Flp pilus assembly protein TadG